MKILLIAAQPILLALMTLYAHAPIYFGKEILVRTELYDPRDMFRGNYVDLSYEFSNVNGGRDEKRGAGGDKIYAVLKPNNDGVYALEYVSADRPEDGVFLSGRIDMWDRANFGIEAYFLPKDKAIQLENQMRQFVDFSEEERKKIDENFADANASKPATQEVKDSGIAMIEPETGWDEAERLGRKFSVYARLKVLSNGDARVDGVELVDNKTKEKIYY